MTNILSALLPIFVLILFGYGLRRLAIPGDDFWPPAARLVYFVLFPALLVDTLAMATLSSAALPVVLSAVLTVLTISLILLALKMPLGIGHRVFTSILQGSIRHNSYVGLAAAAGLFGDAGLALIAVIFAAVIPLVNVICVAALSYFAPNARVNWLGTLRAIGTNPLIVACVVGLLLNWSGLGLLWGSGQVLELLSRAALPLGLLVVGADLSVRSIGPSMPAVFLATALRLVCYPLLIWGWCIWFAVDDPARSVALLFGALPTATSAYVLALQLGGDEKLMATIITGQTAFSVVTIPLILALLSG